MQPDQELEPVSGVEEESEEPTQESAQESPPESEPVVAETKPREPTDEIKVIIVMKADNILIGLQSPDCDPVYKTFKGTMAFALKQVPGLVKEANRQWDESPRYPKADLPEPEPAPAPARTPARTPATPRRTEQPSFF